MYLNKLRPAWKWAGGYAALAAMVAVFGIPQAQAIPAYAQQTHMACEACHIGAFGPQLTPFGRQFKLLGYTLKVGSGLTPKVSAMVVEAFTHTQAPQPQSAVPAGYNPNDNWSMAQASLFLGGHITDHLGVFAQYTYSQADGFASWDNAEIRYARTTSFGSHSVIWGISVNNNPSLSDLYNSTPAWGYPYMGSDLAPGAPAAPMVMGGLGQGVIGASAYTQIDGKWYFEAGAYRSLSAAFLNHVNADYPGLISSAAPYLRFAYQANLSPASNLEVGGLYFASKINPTAVAGQPTDDYKDYGIDANYQWFGANYKHIVTVQALYVHEKQTLNNTYAAGGASNLNNTLDSINLNAAYWYENTYGVTLAALTNNGSSDNLLYGGSPDTNGGMVELDWNPFGKNDSWHQPLINLRVGLQYTFYSKFNGMTNNASDNNTTYVSFWTVF